MPGAWQAVPRLVRAPHRGLLAKSPGGFPFRSAPRPALYGVPLFFLTMIPLYKNGGLINSFNYDALLASLSAAPIEGLEPALELRNELHGATHAQVREVLQHIMWVCAVV